MKTKTIPTLLAFLIVGLAVAGITLSFQLDQSVRGQIVTAQGKGWKKTLDYRIHGTIRRYGDWPWLMAGGGAGALVAWRLKRRDWTRILVAAMVASTLAGAVANSSRLTTGRTRPRASPDVEQGWYGVHHQGKWLIGNSKYNSFPSGHTATAFGFAGVILYASPLWGLLAIGAAGWVAWSSIVIGAHHVSDVVVSVVLSLVVAWIVWKLARSRGDEIAQWILRKFRRVRPS